MIMFISSLSLYSSALALCVLVALATKSMTNGIPFGVLFGAVAANQRLQNRCRLEASRCFSPSSLMDDDGEKYIDALSQRPPDRQKANEVSTSVLLTDCKDSMAEVSEARMDWKRG